MLNLFRKLTHWDKRKLYHSIPFQLLSNRFQDSTYNHLGNTSPHHSIRLQQVGSNIYRMAMSTDLIPRLIQM